MSEILENTRGRVTCVAIDIRYLDFAPFDISSGTVFGIQMSLSDCLEIIRESVHGVTCGAKDITYRDFNLYNIKTHRKIDGPMSLDACLGQL